jgi:dinuclear metal center YbgI/SA1388 family protein
MRTTANHISDFFQDWAPLKTKLDYDNVGLLIGKPDKVIDRILVCLDVTEEIVQEAIENQADLIIAHHPVIFRKISSVTTGDYTGRLIYRLIQNDIAVLAAHTNLDAAPNGVSFALAEKIGLSGCVFLENTLESLQCIRFISRSGQIPKIKSVLQPFNILVFPLENGNVMIECKADSFRTADILRELARIVPDYHDSLTILPVAQKSPGSGFGVLGELKKGLLQDDFLAMLAESLGTDAIRYSGKASGVIKKVAVCGGAGVTLKKKAIESGADAFVTADIKYHDFFTGKPDFLLADVGHFESEAPVIDRIATRLGQAFPEIEVFVTGVNTNPVRSYRTALQTNRINKKHTSE